jgi:hypothetical protein
VTVDGCTSLLHADSNCGLERVQKYRHRLESELRRRDLIDMCLTLSREYLALVIYYGRACDV